jgi:cytochrome oxidase Cu insertion factor (SCO1/SenC/PrrC family)
MRGTVLGLLLAALPVSQGAVHVVPLLQTGDRIPGTRFVDSRGRSFAFDDFRGRAVILAFVYTRCRDAKECPLVSARFAQLQKRAGNGPYHLVEITLDPGYDSPPILARYAAKFGADPERWTLGTGDPDAVFDFARRFGIDPFPDPRFGIIHTERTTLIDPGGKIVDFDDQAGWSVDDMFARLQAAGGTGRSPNWLARLDFELSKAAVAICGDRVAGFSGLEDLGIVLVIFAAGGWALVRLGRKIFVEGV